MSFEIDPDYNEVPVRIREFRGKYPDGCLQPYNPKKPFTIVTVGDKTFIAYTAAAYRTPDDPKPGIAVAWEPFPGKTPYTKDSELMNAETSAWGRALIAVLAADAKRIASNNEVRNREADREVEANQPPPSGINWFELVEGATTLEEAQAIWRDASAAGERTPELEAALIERSIDLRTKQDAEAAQQAAEEPQAPPKRGRPRKAAKAADNSVGDAQEAAAINLIQDALGGTLITDVELPPEPEGDQ